MAAKKTKYEGVRVPLDSSTSIEIDFRYRGKRVIERLKLKPTDKNLRYAFNLREQILEAISRNEFDFVKFFPSSKDKAVKLGFAVEAEGGEISSRLSVWLAAKKPNITKSSWVTYSKMIARELNPAFGHLTAAQLTTTVVRQWVLSKTSAGWPAKRVNNYLIPLRAVMHDALLDGELDRNPMDRVENMPVARSEPDPFSPEEAGLILNHLQQRNLQVWAYFAVAFYAGLRPAELLGLKWDCVDFEKGEIHVSESFTYGEFKGTKTKGSVRQVPILPPAAEALRALPRLGDRVFYNPITGRPWLDEKAPRLTYWKPALEQLGIRYRVPYQTRHSFASWMLSWGENPMWVAHVLGHVDWSMIVKVYGRWIPTKADAGGLKALAILKEGSK